MHIYAPVFESVSMKVSRHTGFTSQQQFDLQTLFFGLIRKHLSEENRITNMLKAYSQLQQSIDMESQQRVVMELK